MEIYDNLDDKGRNATVWNKTTMCHVTHEISICFSPLLLNIFFVVLVQEFYYFRHFEMHGPDVACFC